MRCGGWRGGSEHGGNRASTGAGKSANAAVEAGYRRYGAGDVDGAIAAFRQALGVDANDPYAYANLGLALIDKGNLPEAAAALEKAISLIDAYEAAHPPGRLVGRWLIHCWPQRPTIWRWCVISKGRRTRRWLRCKLIWGSRRMERR